MFYSLLLVEKHRWKSTRSRTSGGILLVELPHDPIGISLTFVTTIRYRFDSIIKWASAVLHLGFTLRE